MTAPQPVRNWEGQWGERLTPRGRKIARLMNDTSNPTVTMKERMDLAQELAAILVVSPHQAWRLAHDTRIGLGWGHNAYAVYDRIKNHEPPDNAWPSAEEWMAMAGLDDDGRPRQP